MMKKPFRKLNRRPGGECGAISIVETLIVLGVATALAAVYANNKLAELEVRSAEDAGRTIAAFSRAAAAWLAEAPPAGDGRFDITSLQDCADPAGARFLPCTFNANTPIPNVFEADGDPTTLGNLIIEVDVTPAQVNGDIDFGVFRSGDDDNGDGLPDSRPDLAAAAFRTAAEETGAGVFDFFRVAIARDDATGIIFDPTDPGFDQDAIDDLSRIEAQVGANAGNVPFLRVDGGNQMTGNLEFNNDMRLTMDADNLNFEGLGNVGIQTDTGTLVVATEVQTDNLIAATSELDAAEIDEITVTPLDGVVGEGFDRLDQTADVTRLDTVTADHETRITTNTSDLALNRARIIVNEGRIGTNAADIVTNASDIAANTASISVNAGNITTNQGNISDNAAKIQTNAANIANNQLDIADNTSNIATNESNISSNALNIENNSINIQTNVADIATNSTNIASNSSEISANTADIETNIADIASNTLGVASNSTDIAMHENTLENHEARIVVLEDKVDKIPPPNNPPTICNPNHAQLVTEKAAQGWPHVETCSFNCDLCKCITTSGTYEERDLNTLQCVTKTHIFAKVVEKATGGNCPDPYCNK